MSLWPFVGRAVLEAVERERDQWMHSSHAWSAQCEGLRDVVRRREEKNDDLVREMLAMRREGFTPAPTLPATKPAPSLVDEAIASRAGTNASLRRHLQSFAASAKREGNSEERILDLVTNWSAREPDEDGG